MQEVQEFVSEKLSALEFIEKPKITSMEGAKQAQDLLNNVGKIKKELKEKKESVTKPLNTALKNFRELFRKAEEKVEEIDGAIRSAIVSFQIKIEKETEEKKRELAQKISEGKIEGEKALQKLEKIEEKTQLVSTRKIQEIVIVDANLIPREYLLPDMVAIRRALLSGMPVSGVELREKIIASVSKN